MPPGARNRRGGTRQLPRWLPSLGLLVAVSLLGVGSRGAPPATAGRGAAFAPTRSSAPWAEAADAVRRRDFDSARRLVAGTPDAPGERRLVLGLWAHASGDDAAAVELLHSAAEPGGSFEDWRLYALADSHATLDQLPAAAALLARLLQTEPQSPLHALALLRAIEVAGRLGDLGGALAWVERGREIELPPAARRALEEAAWRAAVDAGSLELQRRVARHLLVHHPLVASELRVIELFRHPSGALDWLEILSIDQLLERARSLLAVGVTAGALEALEAIPAARREQDWAMLKADGLTRAERGGEALKLLAPLVGETRAVAIQLEELRAAATLAAARSHRQRPLPTAAERELLQRAGQQHLRRVLELAAGDAGHREAALRAHRRLLAGLADDEPAELALGLVRTLARLDPEDTAGAGFLWQRGWDAYQQRDHTAAIRYWSELGSLYAASELARAGQYWSARAYENLGDRGRANGLYRQVAAVGADDFYRRHAVARLGGAEDPHPAGAGEPTEPWPWDPALGRARWLSDRGLDELALIEIRGLSGRAEPRAAAGLEAIVLARQGRPRDSIHALRRTFPQLGGLRQASAPAAALELYYPTAFEPIVRHLAAAHGIPAPLLFAMIRQESAFDPEAVSRSGARGLMQLMPATGRELAGRLRLQFSIERLSDPEFNVRLGASYFRQVLEMFDGNEQLALAGYNAGPYRIRRLWRSAGSAAEIDLFLEGLTLEETKRYVKRVLLFSDTYQRLYDSRV